MHVQALFIPFILLAVGAQRTKCRERPTGHRLWGANRHGGGTGINKEHMRPHPPPPLESPAMKESPKTTSTITVPYVTFSTTAGIVSPSSDKPVEIPSTPSPTPSERPPPSESAPKAAEVSKAATKPPPSEANPKSPTPTTTAPPKEEKPPAVSSVIPPKPPAEPPKADVPPSTSGSPVGLAMDVKSKADISSFGGKIGWYYSWNRGVLPGTEGLEFVPMIWGADMAENFDAVLPAGTKHIMGFNEPDIANEHGGSMIDATAAAGLHKSWTAKLPGGISVGSPSVARGGKAWMETFFTACGSDCKVDFVPNHFYGTSAADLISYTKDFYTTFKKPIWVTEWACQDYSTGAVCNADEVKAYMKTSIDWFRSDEGKKMVQRWSWFGAFPDKASGGNANGILNPDGKANEVGLYYAGL